MINAETFHLEEIQTQDVSILCVSSSLQSHSLAQIINNVFSFDLSRKNDFYLLRKGNKISADYPFYHSSSETRRIHFALVKNKNNGIVLIEALKNVDYVFVLIGRDNQEWSRCILQNKHRFLQMVSFIPYEFRTPNENKIICNQLSLIEMDAVTVEKKKRSKKDRAKTEIVDVFLPNLGECLISMEWEEDYKQDIIRKAWRNEGFSRL